jgi:flagellar hook-associated protein 1 FlgK
LSDLLSIGKTGLAVSKKSIETAGHNIANANTDGYSRQRVHQTNNTPFLKSGLIMGTGAKIKSISRIEEDNLEKRVESAISDQHFFKERMLQLDQVEQIFNESDSEGLNNILGKFYNSFRELANQPENDTVRYVVRDSATLVTQDIRRIRGNLDSQAERIDKKITTHVAEVNQILNHLSELNKQITTMENIGDHTGDLRDQRDLSLRSLSEYFKIQTYVDGKGHFTVNADGLGTLVSSGQVAELVVRGVTEEDSRNGMAGSTEIFFKDRPLTSVSHKLQRGTLSSLFKARNEDIQQLQKDIDGIAFNLANSVNAIHAQGIRYTPATIDPETGTPTAKDGKPISGINFFQKPLSEKNAANNIELSFEVQDDLSNIITAISPDSPGDNRIALAISKLQHQKIMDNGTATMEENYLKSIGKLGLQTGKNRLDEEQSDGLYAQAKSIKERVTGVSIDEEAGNLIRFQHAYEASAKVMKTAEEMFDTIMSIKR